MSNIVPTTEVVRQTTEWINNIRCKQIELNGNNAQDNLNLIRGLTKLDKDLVYAFKEMIEPLLDDDTYVDKWLVTVESDNVIKMQYMGNEDGTYSPMVIVSHRENNFDVESFGILK